MSNLQSRPLSGLVTAGTLAAGVLAVPVAAATVHTLDPNIEALVDIFVNNTTGGALVVTVTVMGVAIALSVAANSTVQVLDRAAFRGSNAAGAANLITASCPQAGIVLWGRVQVA